MLAAYMLHINIVNILLESRADVNMKEDQYGNTALTMAASVYVKDRTREYGAKRNEEASEEDRISIIKNLVEHGADINIRNKYGRTALSIASTRNSIYAVQILIDLGADVNIKDNDGDTALMMAMKYNQSTQKEGIVKLLKKSEAKK